jgi:hypothetical protein
MSTIDIANGEGIRALHQGEVDAVNGAGVAPGYGSLGTRLNISPFQWGAPFDMMWEIVGRTGTLPQ